MSDRIKDDQVKLAANLSKDLVVFFRHNPAYVMAMPYIAAAELTRVLEEASAENLKDLQDLFMESIKEGMKSGLAERHKKNKEN